MVLSCRAAIVEKNPRLFGLIVTFQLEITNSRRSLLPSLGLFFNSNFHVGTDLQLKNKHLIKNNTRH